MRDHFSRCRFPKRSGREPRVSKIRISLPLSKSAEWESSRFGESEFCLSGKPYFCRCNCLLISRAIISIEFSTSCSFLKIRRPKFIPADACRSIRRESGLPTQRLRCLCTQALSQPPLFLKMFFIFLQDRGLGESDEDANLCRIGKVGRKSDALWRGCCKAPHSRPRSFKAVVSGSGTLRSSAFQREPVAVAKSWSVR